MLFSARVDGKIMRNGVAIAKGVFHRLLNLSADLALPAHGNRMRKLHLSGERSMRPPAPHRCHIAILGY